MLNSALAPMQHSSRLCRVAVLIHLSAGACALPACSSLLSCITPPAADWAVGLPVLLQVDAPCSGYPSLALMHHACQEGSSISSPNPPVALDVCLHLLDVCLAALGGLLRLCHTALSCLRGPRSYQKSVNRSTGGAQVWLSNMQSCAAFPAFGNTPPQPHTHTHSTDAINRCQASSHAIDPQLAVSSAPPQLGDVLTLKRSCA